MEVKKDEKGNAEGGVEGYCGQGLAGPLSPGMPDEMMKAVGSERALLLAMWPPKNGKNEHELRPAG